MLLIRSALFCLALIFITPPFALAHFGMVIPSAPTVMSADKSTVSLDVRFWHPFENAGMNLEKPNVFSVYYDGKATDLRPTLKAQAEQGQQTWTTDYKISRPGLYTFFMEPVPYFEPEEDCYIVHYTKAFVDAYGDDDGWDQPLGVKAEMILMIRPGALYAGNVFQAQVLLDGKPVPGVEVEVEWYPGPNLQGVAPYESMITQTVKADSEGVFVYAAPTAGWWGFAALMEAEGLDYKGEEKAVEIGAVAWVYFHAVPSPVSLEK